MVRSCAAIIHMSTVSLDGRGELLSTDEDKRERMSFGFELANTLQFGTLFSSVRAHVLIVVSSQSSAPACTQ